MTEALIALMVCGTVIYIARMFRPMPRILDAREGVPLNKELPPVPDDLLLQANKWHDAWAREQALKNIQELYETTGSWDRVRYVYSQISIEDGEN